MVVSSTYYVFHTVRVQKNKKMIRVLNQAGDETRFYQEIIINKSTNRNYCKCKRISKG